MCLPVRGIHLAELFNPQHLLGSAERARHMEEAAGLGQWMAMRALLSEMGAVIHHQPRRLLLPALHRRPEQRMVGCRDGSGRAAHRSRVMQKKDLGLWTNSTFIQNVAGQWHKWNKNIDWLRLRGGNDAGPSTHQQQRGASEKWSNRCVGRNELVSSRGLVSDREPGLGGPAVDLKGRIACH